MRTHVQRTVSRCFAALRQIRRSVPSATLQMLEVALVHSRLDYGNGVLVGLPAHLVRRLQSVLNAVAQLIYRPRTRDHITDALVVGSGTNSVQAGYSDVQSCTSLHGDASRYPGPADPRPRFARMTTTRLYQHQPPRSSLPQVKLSTISLSYDTGK